MVRRDGLRDRGVGTERQCRPPAAQFRDAAHARREELAAWLWERKLFKAAKGETRRTPRSRAPSRSWGRRVAMTALAAGLAAALALGFWIERDALLELPAFAANLRAGP